MWLCQTPNEASSLLTSKPDTAHTGTDNTNHRYSRWIQMQKFSKKKKSANQSQHYIKKITYHDQVGIYLRGAKVAQHSKISKCQKSCQQNEEQKPYDPFNRCREGILYFKTKTLNKLWYRRKIPQSDKGHIWLNNSHIVVKRKSWKNFSSYLEQDNDVQFYCSYSLYRCHLGQLVQGLKLESHTTPT